MMTPLGSYSLMIFFRQRGRDDRQCSSSAEAVKGSFLPPSSFLDGGISTFQRDAVRFVSSLRQYLPRSHELIKHGRVILTGEEFEGFILGSCKTLTSLSVDIEMPSGMKKLLSKPKVVGLASRVPGDDEEFLEDGRVVQHMKLKELCDFDARIAVGDELLTIEEFEKLVTQAKGKKLINVNRQFIHLDANEVADTLRDAKERRETLQSGEEVPTTYDLIKSHAVGEDVSAGGQQPITNFLSRPVKNLVEMVLARSQVSLPKGLRATLRHYQEEGFNFLPGVALRMGGCILADVSASYHVSCSQIPAASCFLS